MAVKFSARRDSNKDKKISAKEGYFFCFNMIVGYAFILGVSSVFQQVGNFFILLILICSFLALIVGLAYAKLARHYDSNGGAFLYTYKAFGKKPAYFIGWFQYIKTPVVGLSAILGMVWAFEKIGGIGSNGTYPWWLYVIASSLFILIFIFLYFGLTGGRIALAILSVLKWSLLLFVLVLALIFIPSFGKNIVDNNYRPEGWTDQWHTFLAFIPATLTFFFAYGGFEDFASMNSDFENPKSTVPKILVFVFITSTIFYIIVFYLFIGSLGATGKNGLDPNYKGNDVNPINSIIYQTFSSGAGFVVAVIVAVSQLANKSCGRLQTSWTVARQLEPLTSSGFMPHVLSRRNKYGQYQRLILLDSIIVFTLIGIYLLIAILVYKTQRSGRLSGALSIYSFVAFIVYAATLSSLLKLSTMKNNDIKLNIGEKIIYTFGLFVLFFFLVFYVVAGVVAGDGGQSLYLQLGTIGGFLLIGGIIYVCGTIFGWHKHEKSHDYYLDHVEDPVTVSSI